MAGPTELPHGLLAGERMLASDLLSGVKIEGPRLGDDFIFDNDRAMTIVGVLGPDLVAGFGIEHDESAT